MIGPQTLSRLYKALRHTGILSPNPPRALASFLRCYTQYGSSLVMLAAWSATRFPDEIALAEVDSGKTTKSVTFKELLQEAQKRAAHLQNFFSLRSGQSVAFLGQNSVTYVETLLACELLGLRVLFLHSTMDAATLEHFYHHHPFRLLLCDTASRAKLTAFIEHLDNIKHIENTKPALHCFDEPFEVKQSFFQPFASAARKSQRILLTSGTTGVPKFIERGPAFPLQSFTALLERLELQTGNKTLLTLPLFHGHGLATLAFTLLFGSPLYLNQYNDAKSILSCLQQQHIHVLTLVPTVLYRLLEQFKQSGQPRWPRKSSSLRHILSGSG
ncbi:MAG: AMP-binding protein, partial [Trueperaceae bacterium]